MTTYCTNLRTAELTEYTNFDFLAFCRLGNRYFGLKADGLYELGGDTDAGADIDARFKTHPTDFGFLEKLNPAMLKKRLPYLRISNAKQPVEIRPFFDGRATGIYLGAERVRMSRKAEGRFVAFEVRNLSGGALQPAGIELVIQFLSRTL